MYIKSINNVIGYKDLPDGFSTQFNENKTYIVGANFQRKSTVGSLFNWCLTGTSLAGKEKEQVANDSKKVSNVIVDITFVDNYGIEHRLVRDKGKEIQLILDGKEIKQENLINFYKDKDVFLVAHNPYYFWMLEPKQQKDLIRNILPSIEPEDAFNLLSEDEKNVLGSPIEQLGSYTLKKNQAIYDLEKDREKYLGMVEAIEKIAIEDEGEILEFEKEEELNKLTIRYEELSSNFDNSNLEDIQRSIETINRRLQELLSNDLAKITDNYNRENNKLKELDSKNPICPSCRQEMKNADAIEHLRNFYKKELDRFQQDADNLKERAKSLNEEKKQKQELLNKLSTTEMKVLEEEKNILKEKLDILQKQKDEIILHNQEVKIKAQNIRKAKETLKQYKEIQNEIERELVLNKKQKDIANKLKILVIESQKEKIKKYLTKVDIEFSKVAKTTGEVTECCNIKYEGRDFKNLSKSQQARASLEISNVFNNISGINAPIFFDDAESTTDIQDIPNTQLIISLVVKYNPLEILYNYEDVLDRRKKSIQKEIEENSCYEVKIAA